MVKILITDFLMQRIAGEIKSFSTDGWVEPKLVTRLDKFMLYVLTAGKKALENGGITEEVMKELDKARCGVLVGSGMGGMQVMFWGFLSLECKSRKIESGVGTDFTRATTDRF